MGTAPPAQGGDGSQHRGRDRTSRRDGGAQALGSGRAGGKSPARSRRRRRRERMEAAGWGGRQKLPFQVQNPSPAPAPTGSGAGPVPAVWGHPHPATTTQNEATGTHSAGGGDRWERRTSTLVPIVPLRAQGPARTRPAPCRAITRDLKSRGSRYRTRSLQALDMDERGLVKSPCPVSPIPVFSAIAHFQSGAGMRSCLLQRGEGESCPSAGIPRTAQRAPPSIPPSFPEREQKLKREGNNKTPARSEGGRVI